MSVVIIGGNECMVCKYKQLCRKYNCKAKVFVDFNEGMRSRIGSPDLMVLFTSTMSHKMVKSALDKTKGSDCIIARSHTSSMNALKNILEEHAVFA